MEEQWLPVVGYEGAYEVSNIGQLKSLSRKLTDGRTCKERIIKGTINGTGRRLVVLQQNGRKRCCFIYQLVAEAFIGPRPIGYSVNHKNSDCADDRLENLEYVTPKQNTQHAAKAGWLAHGERHGRTHLTTEQVIEMRALYDTGDYTQRVLARKYGITQRAVWQILKRITWVHV